MNRYQQHLRLAEFANQGQEKLLNSKVLVVGAGGLGCPAIIYLAGAGIGELGIIDNDVIELSNLHRQILFTESDLGKSKAEIAATRAQQINSEIKIRTYIERLTVANAEKLISYYDVIIDASDNFSTTYLLNDACVIYQKPLVYAAIQKFHAMQSNFIPQMGCYRCLFPDKPTVAVGSCNEVGVVGPLPGIMGSIQALETIKIILGVKIPIQFVQFDFLSLDQKKFKYSKDENCIVCGNAPRITKIDANNYQFNIPANRWISLTEAQAKNLIWIDIRSPEEFSIGHIENAINLPLAEFQMNLLPAGDVIIYCETGRRCEAIWPKVRVRDNILFLDKSEKQI